MMKMTLLLLLLIGSSCPQQQTVSTTTYELAQVPPMLVDYHGPTDFTGYMPRTIYYGPDIGAFEWWMQGDFNFDASVDAADWPWLEWCWRYSGPGVPCPSRTHTGTGEVVTIRCLLADEDNDGDIDLYDVAAWMTRQGNVHLPPSN